MATSASSGLAGHIRGLALNLALGLVFVAYNFGSPLRDAGTTWAAYPVIQPLLLFLAGLPDATFPRDRQAGLAVCWELMRLSLLGVWIYLAATVLLSVARTSLAILASAAIGLLLGYLGIPLIAWTVIIAVFVINIALWIASSVWWIVSTILGFISAVFAFLAPYLGILFGIAAAIGLLIGGYFLLRWLTQRFRLLGILSVLIGVALLYVSIPVFTWIYTFIIAPLIGFLTWLIGSIVGFLIWIVALGMIVCLALGGVILFIGSCGALLRDQFVGAWRCSSGTRGMFLGSFSLALGFSTVVWASSTAPDTAFAVDDAWRKSIVVTGGFSPVGFLTGLLPAQLLELDRWIFAKAGPQCFDAAVLVMLVAVSSFSMLRGLRYKSSDAFHVKFVSREVVAVGLVVALAIPALVLVAWAALTSSESS